jgi:sterol desaturase/sphingolipid hydroxylase (fatty acid hydroxylase superfamily)
MAVALVLLMLVLSEFSLPARSLFGRGKARLLNLSAGVFNGLALRLVLPAGLATWAGIATTQLGRDPLPFWAGFVVLDFALYLQHWACHRYPILWRLHAAHHSDSELDITTGLRFHPFEAIASALWKGAIIMAFGIGTDTVWTFEGLLLAASCFSHANVRWRGRAARWLDQVWMTPACHRVHHGLSTAAQRRNLAFGMTLWDRLFGTWSAADSDGPVGLPADLGRDSHKWRKFLSFPFIIK